MNVITPSSHKRLVEEILQTGGCLISEYLQDAKATKSTYVERDSLVAALADGTLVVECSVKSGTMHTVHAATSMNKKLACYYPQNSRKGNYEGNFHMIKENGALPLKNTDDLKSFLQSLSVMKNAVTANPLKQEQLTLNLS